MRYRILLREAGRLDVDLVHMMGDVSPEYARNALAIARGRSGAGDWLRLEFNRDGGIIWTKVESLTVPADV